MSRANLTQENFANFEILPKFRSLYDEEEKPIKFFPAAFKFPQTVPEEYVLFEDLQYKAFRTITGDLSSKQMEMVLDNLAAFHAASVVGTKFNNVNKTSPASPNVDLQKLSNRIFHEHLRSYKLKCYEDKIVSKRVKGGPNSNFF